MPQLNYELQASVTPYDYIGDEPSFGSLTLTMLAESFKAVDIGDLDILFPDMMKYERNLVIEQLVESHAIMPPAQPGIPNGQYLEPNRLRRFSVTPQIFRENDSIEQLYINQLREPGSVNTARSAANWIAERMRMLTERHRRTKSVFQAKMLLGGWVYYDPRTKVSINANSNIPIHNYVKYDGWGGDNVAGVNAGGDVTIAGRVYQALGNLVPAKDRPDATWFTSTDYKVGVPWTYPQADILRTLILFGQYFKRTNKNKLTHMIINSDLLAVIQTTNEYLKTWQGFPGMLVMNQPDGAAGVAGNAISAASNRTPGPQQITFGPGGEITSIAGLKIIALDGIWRNPANENKKEVYWPAHKVALVCQSSMNNSSATLGYTYHCSAESPDGNPGLWVRSWEDLQTPGLRVTMGDCFIPFPVYPHWISILEVCQPDDIYTSLPILPDLDYGIF